MADGVNAPAWVAAVLPEEIVRQRQLGWPDFHPEDFCHRCGRRNPICGQGVRTRRQRLCLPVSGCEPGNRCGVSGSGLGEAAPGGARKDRDVSENKTGAELIAAERQRQIDAEGWSPDHDDHHTDSALAWAATCYAAPSTVFRVNQQALGRDGGTVRWEEPWPVEWTENAVRGYSGYVPWRRPPVDRITELVKAGALIAAEIDRLQRAREQAQVAS